ALGTHRRRRPLGRRIAGRGERGRDGRARAAPGLNTGPPGGPANRRCTAQRIISVNAQGGQMKHFVLVTAVVGGLIASAPHVHGQTAPAAGSSLGSITLPSDVL